MLKLSSMLDSQLVKITEQCSEEQVVAYRRGFGYVMGYMLTEIMNPIYAEHPELKPKHLGGPYEVDRSVYE